MVTLFENNIMAAIQIKPDQNLYNQLILHANYYCLVTWFRFFVNNATLDMVWMKYSECWK